MLFEGCTTNGAVVPLFVEELERGKAGQTERVPWVLSCKDLHNDFIQNILLFHSRELSILC